MGFIYWIQSIAADSVDIKKKNCNRVNNLTVVWQGARNAVQEAALLWKYWYNIENSGSALSSAFETETLHYCS